MSDATCYVGCDTVVTTTTTDVPAVLPTSTVVEVRPAQAERGLPMTGGDVAGLSVFGTAAIVVGAMMVRWRRRHG